MNSYGETDGSSYGKTGPTAASASVLCFIIRLKRCPPSIDFFNPGGLFSPQPQRKCPYSPSGGKYNAGVLLLFMASLKAGTSVEIICFHAESCWSNCPRSILNTSYCCCDGALSHA